MATALGGGYSPTTIEFRGGLDLTTPPFRRYRNPGACVFMQNYVVVDEGYRLVEGYQKFRGQVVGGADGEGPVYAIAQGQFSGGSINRASVSIEIQLGGLVPSGGLSQDILTGRFSVDSRVDDALESILDTPRATTTQFTAVSAVDTGSESEAAGPQAAVGVDVYVFRRKASGKLGVYRAAISYEGDWTEVPYDGDPGVAVQMSEAGLTATLTEELDPPAPRDRVRWISRSFAANAEPRLFFVTGAGPEFGLYEIVNIGNNYYVVRGIEIGTEVLDALEADEQKYPQFIEAHQNHLFLGYKGGSVLWSGLGEPDDFSALIGAGEVAFPNIGTQLTGLVRGFQSRLWIFGTESIHYVEGSSAQTFAVRPLTEELGSALDTMQLGQTPMFFSNDGIREIGASGEADFTATSLSRQIRPYVQYLAQERIHPTASVMLREKDQYRVYFENRSALVGSLLNRPDGLAWEFATLLYPKSVTVASNTPAPVDAREQYLSDRTLIALGREDAFGMVVPGDEPDGYVYIDGSSHADGAVPTTFDGLPIHGAIQLGLQALREPTVIKRFQRIGVYAIANEQLEVGGSVGFGENSGGLVRRVSLGRASKKLQLPHSSATWAQRFSQEVTVFTEQQNADATSTYRELWGDASGESDSDTGAVALDFFAPGRAVTFDLALSTRVSDAADAANPPPHLLMGASVFWKALRYVKAR